MQGAAVPLVLPRDLSSQFQLDWIDCCGSDGARSAHGGGFHTLWLPFTATHSWVKSHSTVQVCLPPLLLPLAQGGEGVDEAAEAAAAAGPPSPEQLAAAEAAVAEQGALIR